MPTVGKKKFKYDEEGMAAAEAEAVDSGQEMSMVDKVDDTLSDLEMPEQDIAMPDEMEPSVDEMAEEEPETDVPDQGLLMQLFRIVYRQDYDPNNQKHQSQLSVIESTLDQNPEMASRLKDGEMSMTDFALRVYKGMVPSEEATMTAPAVTPEAGNSYMA